MPMGSDWYLKKKVRHASHVVFLWTNWVMDSCGPLLTWWASRQAPNSIRGAEPGCLPTSNPGLFGSLG
jgi:hypothetical protein